MQDTCSPTRNLTLKSFRIYSILVPSLLFILAVEGIMIFMRLPSTFGSAITMKSTLPGLPSVGAKALIGKPA